MKLACRLLLRNIVLQCNDNRNNKNEKIKTTLKYIEGKSHIYTNFVFFFIADPFKSKSVINLLMYILFSAAFRTLTIYVMILKV